MIIKNEKETKVLKLTSLKPEEYGDVEIQCSVVEDMKAFVNYYVEELRQKGDSPKRAKKTALVTARQGVVGEEVDTRPRVKRDGKVYVISETKVKVKIEGSMIVKNPDGEEYILKPEVFVKKYKPTNQEGIYEPISEPVKYVTLSHDIVFMAPWGEEMYGVKGAALIISSLDDIYAIQNEAFDKTYSSVQEKSAEFGN